MAPRVPYAVCAALSSMLPTMNGYMLRILAGRHFQYRYCVSPDHCCWDLRVNGRLHGCDALPAVITGGGVMAWYRYDKRHRGSDLPAIVFCRGAKQWWKNDNLHRDGDLPADIWTDDSQRWFKHGKLHRDGDMPAEIWANGSQRWFKHGKRCK